MPQYRISEAAKLLGVSDDTVRRWVDSGRLTAKTGAKTGNGKTSHSHSTGPTEVDGAELAKLAQEVAMVPSGGQPVAESARNRLTGLVTKVTKDVVMAQVDMQCGPFRVVSLMSSEAANELGLEPGVLAVASVKATTVVVEVPHH